MVILFSLISDLPGQDKTGESLVNKAVQDEVDHNARIELAFEVLDLNSTHVLHRSGKDRYSKEFIPTDFHPEAGWEVITRVTFEGSFPAVGWNGEGSQSDAPGQASVGLRACWDSDIGDCPDRYA